MLDPSPEDDRTSPTVSTPHFVGRDREMAALRGALARPPAIVLVEGEAGIGKSRLLREWLAAPDQRTALVSVCPPLRESLTLGPIVDAFRGIDRPVSQLRLTELAGALRPCSRSGPRTCHPRCRPWTMRRRPGIACSAPWTSCFGLCVSTFSCSRTLTGPTR